jgi:two-component system, sensor histidine kinase ChiS
LRVRVEVLTAIARAKSVDDRFLSFTVARMAKALDAQEVSFLQQSSGGLRRVARTGAVPVDLVLSPIFRRMLEVVEPSKVESFEVVPIEQSRFIQSMLIERPAALNAEELEFVWSAANMLEEMLLRHAKPSSEKFETEYLTRFKELTDANNRLKAVNHKKNHLMDVLSHDLRAPLQVLLGHAHMLLDSSEKEVQKSADAIARNSRKMLELVESTLSGQRDSSEQVILNSKTFDISQTCRDAVGDLKILAAEKKITLRCEAPVSLHVQGDEARLRQVLQNLITNGLSHAKGSSVISVLARRTRHPDGDVATVEVINDGAQVDSGELLLAFERSRGLGLSIARDHVERHGGEIWAEPGDAGGARFLFTLPLKKESGSLHKPTNLHLILLAEADPVFARVATLALAPHFRVESVHDGAEVIPKCRSLNPALVLLDVILPRRDGLDVLREMTETAELAHIPVILLTSNKNIATHNEIGATEILVKPVSLSTLLVATTEALKRNSPTISGEAISTDRNTGLLNQLGLLQRLAAELIRCQRFARSLTAALLIPSATNVAVPVAIFRNAIVSPDFTASVGQGRVIVVFPENTAEAVEISLRQVLIHLKAAGSPYELAKIVETTASVQTVEGILERLQS